MSARDAESQLSLLQERPDSAGFEVRRSSRARRLSIRVFPHGRVEVVVPPRTSANTVSRFVAANKSWIERTLSNMAAAGASADLAMPDEIRFQAPVEQWAVDYRTTTRNRLTQSAEPAGGRLELAGPQPRGPIARARLRRWVVEQGKRLLLPQLADLAREHGFRYQHAGIGRQRTRWGSCSAQGRIRLNCGLLFLPEHLARHVMLHELCHLRVLNHSRRFWRELDSLETGARALDQEMNSAWSCVPGWLYYGD